MSETRCDICRERVRADDVHYVVERHDQRGYFDSLDVCSVGCLAAASVGEAHGRGVRGNHRAVQSKLAGAPKKTRKWWNR